MTSRKEVDRSRITDVTPVRLALAAELAFPDGSVSEATLRREISMGRLTAWKVGTRLLTSQAEIVIWLDRCRVEADPYQAPPARVLADGRPREAVFAAAQEACRQTLQRLKDNHSQKKAEAKDDLAKAGTRPGRPTRKGSL